MPVALKELLMRAHTDTQHKETDILDKNDPARGERDVPDRAFLISCHTDQIETG